ncbi:MAG: sensor histidine kinase [Jatrophihabitans sp.]|uniref:sensor histidine kinase n=1 Tax=Jatrophihabitans sp. TaxID=1932789 RepID=UPI003F7D9123
MSVLTALSAPRRRWARTPLRVKLVATMLLLVTVALGAAGFAGAATLRNYLVGRLDGNLVAAQHQIIEHALGDYSTQLDPDDHSGPPPGRADARNGLPSEYVAALHDASGTQVYINSAFADQTRSLPDLPEIGLVTHQQWYTVNAVQGDDQWRVLAVPYTDDGDQYTLFIAAGLGGVSSTVHHLELLELIIGAITLVVVAGAGYLVVRASMRPLREVERTAADIAAGDLSHRVPEADPRTEVGQLGLALNAMLNDIERAFAERAASEQAARTSEEKARVSESAARESEQRMRRFVADASHELRTPLTSIRGFAELYRQGAVTDPDDLERVMQRIEAEAQRMGVLVEDLLLLARMDQERPLAQAPVDVLELATDAVHDARAIDPDRPITLSVGNTDPLPVVVGDEARLRQVLATLVMNALKHTPAGTPVTVRVATAGDTVALEVADRGPGMDPEVAAHVFERFYRADQARRTDGGTGLGLAIVSALIAGHGGTITVDTAPGAGATFRVSLPLLAAPAIARR